MWGFVTSLPEFIYTRVVTSVVAIRILGFPPLLGSHVVTNLSVSFTCHRYIAL